MNAPPDEGARAERGGGPIRVFARHPNAGNLLMALIVLGGIFALLRLNTQFFPDFGIDVVQVSVAWPGAASEDVDATIVQALEPELRFLDGVKRVRSVSSQGAASISVEFFPGSDMQAALSDVENAVGQVTTLPESAERPLIRRIVRFESISRLIVSGPYPPAALKAAAKRIRDDLLARGIDKVDLVGSPKEEIWVELRPETLRRLDLTLADVARAVGASSLDLPAGATRGGVERQVRALGLAQSAEEVGEIEVAVAGGHRLKLKDIATVREMASEDSVTTLHEGRPAIELHIQRAVNADALDLADTVDSYLGEIAGTLPPDLKVEQYDVVADLIRSRVDLLMRNGISGLALVLLVLLVFLNGPVAFWVASGIFVSIMGTLLVMLATGQSINMVSLFALIMALGFVVDDAIVVAEHGETRRRLGYAPLLAAEMGARRMAVPVLASSMTTMVAFVPLLMVSDVIGQLIAAIPLVIVAALAASLVECFLVLPNHLRGALRPREMASSRFRRWFDERFARFRDGPFRRAVGLCLRWRYATLAAAVAMVILSVGLVMGGRVGFVFFHPPEADKVYANLEMVPGTPRADTARMLGEMGRALAAVEERLTEGRGGLVLKAVSRLGGTATMGDTGDNVAGLVIELRPTDQRDVTASEFMRAWRQEIMPQAGVSDITIRPATGGPPGADVDVRLTGGDVRGLKAAAEEIKALLGRYPGVSTIEDDLPWGKDEIVLAVTPRGSAMGFTTESMGRQLRDALEGAIAKRFPRGDEEVEVRVMYPRDAVPAALLDTLYLRAGDGTEAPLSTIARRHEETGFSRIRREDGWRQAAVTAELDKNVTTNDDILNALRRDGIAEIAARHGASFRFAGKAEEQATAFADLRLGAAVALAAIYIILAWVFASYSQPLVVMAVIPLGFVGAAFGHWLLGYNLTILSMVALVGLSGVVVNNSIILVSTINERRRAGAEPFDAILDGTRDRLRAVILTSATTIGGLTPLMFETSLQARFLIPMAITIVFGLIVATLLVLLVVPALLAAQEDFRRTRRGPPTGGETPPAAPARRPAEVAPGGV